MEMNRQGKAKCRTLKEIRRRIAVANHIPFDSPDCRYQGKCSGTCPQCEAEVHYLEKSLCNLERRGIETHVNGICSQMDLSGFRAATDEMLPEGPADKNRVYFDPDGGVQFIPDGVMINGKNTSDIDFMSKRKTPVKLHDDERPLTGLIRFPDDNN